MDEQSGESWMIQPWCYGNVTALAAKYDSHNPLSTSDFQIKLHIWKSFEKTIVN